MSINWQEVGDRLLGDITTLVIDLIVIIVILAAAKLILEMLSKATGTTIKKASKIQDSRRAKEIITGMTLLRSAARYLIYFVAVCLIINQLGYGTAVSNVVAAAGIGALVVSLGAQSIIGDIIAGAFIMFENQYAVGDYVRINEYEGTVTSLALRCTYLKKWTGERIIVPNGTIRTLINYTTDYNMGQVDVPVPYEADIEKVTEMIRETAQKYADEHRNVCLEDPIVASVNAYDSSSMKVSVFQKTPPRQYFGVQRDLRVLIKKRFDEEGISIPYEQIVVHQAGEQDSGKNA